MICLDEMLFGTPTWEQVVEFFKNGEFHEEQYDVLAIKKHLLTSEQRQTLFDLNLSIEDMLNGRIGGEQRVYAIFDQWNEKLGFKCFGFSR
jgi:hypothetical protein